MAQAPRLATFDDLARLPDDARVEILGGVVVEKAAPSAEHADAQSAMVALLKPAFQRKPGAGGPGGWWLLTEVDAELRTHDVFRPDLAGWRRDRVPERPSGRPVRTRPDFWCEVVSPSNAKHDLVDKLRVLQACEVAHYWLVDPDRRTLTVLRWTAAGYLTVLVAADRERVRAEPFDAIELPLGQLFGDDPE